MAAEPYMIANRSQYWRKVVAELATMGWRTLDEKPLHWPTVERLMAARGFTAGNITDPMNMVGVIDHPMPPPNF